MPMSDTDIVDRLRWQKRYTQGIVPVTMEYAAKEIERLRSELAGLTRDDIEAPHPDDPGQTNVGLPHGKFYVQFRNAWRDRVIARRPDRILYGWPVETPWPTTTGYPMKDAFDQFHEWANKPKDSYLTIPADLHHAVTSLPGEDWGDREKVNAAVEKQKAAPTD